MSNAAENFVFMPDPAIAVAATSRGEGRRTLELRAAVLDVLNNYSGPMSGRQIFYQLVSCGAIENTAKDYSRALRLIVKMRRDGSIPYSRIVDRTRAKHQAPSWDGVQRILEVAASQYRRNLWDDQETVPMIAVEKVALYTVFSQIVDDYGVSLWPLKGFDSESFGYEWGEDIRDLNAKGKRVAVTYFGDFDPSGLCIEQTEKRKLEEFGAVFSWQRSGLQLADFDALKLLRVPIKKKDSRAKAFVAKFGDRAAELDALHPADLERRIRQAIEAHIDSDKWERLKAVESAEREELQIVVRNWDAAVAAARGAA